MKVEHYIKKGVCETICPNDIGIENDNVHVGSTACTWCKHYGSEYIKDGKRIVDCNFNPQKRTAQR